MIKLESLPRKKEDVASRTIDGKGVLVRAGAGEVDILNPSGALIWELIDGKRKVSDLVERIREEYEVDEETAKKDVLDFLEELRVKDAIDFV